MRLVVMFDLPVTTTADKRNYRKFRKFLIKSGYMMLQESIYCKIAQNSQAADWMVENIKKIGRPRAACKFCV